MIGEEGLAYGMEGTSAVDERMRFVMAAEEQGDAFAGSVIIGAGSMFQVFRFVREYAPRETPVRQLDSFV